MDEYEMANELVRLKAKHGKNFCMDLAMETLAKELPRDCNERDDFIAKLAYILTGLGLEIN